jgi:hypothetical protein
MTDQVIQILCAALNRGRFLSCAHLAQVVREACDEYEAPAALRASIEAELGLSLERPDAAQETKLALAGMLPRCTAREGDGVTGLQCVLPAGHLDEGKQHALWTSPEERDAFFARQKEKT